MGDSNPKWRHTFRGVGLELEVNWYEPILLCNRLSKPLQSRLILLHTPFQTHFKMNRNGPTVCYLISFQIQMAPYIKLATITKCHMFDSSLPPVVCGGGSCLICVICVCLRIAVSNTYVASFGGLSIFDCPLESDTLSWFQPNQSLLSLLVNLWEK
jgi:hypothetical protein